MRVLQYAARLRSGALVWLLGGLLYAGSLGHGFVGDDQAAIRDNPIVHRGHLREVWTSDYWAGYHSDRSGLYRPLTVWSFALQYRLSGPDPRPYHLLNLLLHATVALLVYGTARALTRREDLGLVSGLVFAAHPVLSEAVVGVVGRADLLATLFGLVAVRQHLRSGGRRIPWTALALLAALSSKESAIAVPVLLLLCDLFQYRVFGAPGPPRAGAGWSACADSPPGQTVSASLPARRGLRGAAASLRAGGMWLAYLVYAVVVVLFLCWRRHVLGGLAVPQIDPLDNPLVSLDLPLRLLNATVVLLRYLGLLLLPVRLSADYSLAALPLARHLVSPELLVAVAGVAGLAALLALSWRAVPWACCGLAWLLLALAPVANLLLPIGTIMAERLLYLPAAGWALAVAALLLTPAGRRAPGTARLPGASGATEHRLGVGLAAGLLAALLGLRTVARVADWRDQYTLYASAVQAYPGSARAWHYLGQAALARGETELGLQALERALQILPTYYEVHNDLGANHYARGDYPAALTAFGRCLALRGDYPPAWLNLGLSHYRLGQRREAEAAFRRAADLDPGYARAYFSLGVVLLEAGQAEEAATCFRRVLELEPADPGADANLKAAMRLLERHPTPSAPTTGQGAGRMH